MGEIFGVMVFIGSFSLLTMGAIIGGIIAMNAWSGRRAHRQFTLLAGELHAVLVDPPPTWGPRLYRLEGRYQGQTAVVETVLSTPAHIAIGNGAVTRSQAILTHVRVGEKETVFNWYMTSNRKRGKVQKFLTQGIPAPKKVLDTTGMADVVDGLTRFPDNMGDIVGDVAEAVGKAADALSDV